MRNLQVYYSQTNLVTIIFTGMPLVTEKNTNEKLGLSSFHILYLNNFLKTTQMIFPFSFLFLPVLHSVCLFYIIEFYT